MKALVIGCLLAAMLSGCVYPNDSGTYEDGTDQVAPIGLPLTDWPMFSGNIMGWNHHPGDFPYCKAEPYTAWRQCIGAAWKIQDFNTGAHGAAKSSAILYDGTIYVGSDEGTLHAFTLDGQEVWNASLEPSKNGIHGTPAAVGDRVFIGGYDGAMYAFDRHTGERLWHTPVGSWIGSSPRPYGDEIFIAVEHGGVTKAGVSGGSRAWGDVQVLDQATGDILWKSQELGSHPHSTVAISPDDNAFVVGSNDDHVYAWDLDTRELRWSFHADRGEQGDIKGPILIWDSKVYFGSWDGNFYAVDIKTGEQVWRHEGEDWFMTGAAIDPARGTIYFGGHDQWIIAADAHTGDIVWKHKMGARIVGSPTLIDGILLFGVNDFHLHAFDAEDGTRLWSYPTKHRLSAAPLIVGDRIVFADRSECGPLVDGECEWGGTHGILYQLGQPD